MNREEIMQCVRKFNHIGFPILVILISIYIFILSLPILENWEYRNSAHLTLYNGTEIFCKVAHLKGAGLLGGTDSNVWCDGITYPQGSWKSFYYDK